MKQEQVGLALSVGHKVAYGDMERSTTICEFARGVEITLYKMAENAKFPKSIIIGMVAGWVKKYADGEGCR